MVAGDSIGIGPFVPVGGDTGAGTGDGVCICGNDELRDELVLVAASPIGWHPDAKIKTSAKANIFLPLLCE